MWLCASSHTKWQQFQKSVNWLIFEELRTKLLLSTFYGFLTRHLKKNVKSRFWKSEQKLKSVFSSTGSNKYKGYEYVQVHVPVKLAAASSVASRKQHWRIVVCRWVSFYSHNIQHHASWTWNAIRPRLTAMFMQFYSVFFTERRSYTRSDDCYTRLNVVTQSTYIIEITRQFSDK